MASKRVHLVCNAHLDPAWLWPWEQGLAETVSTFRIAADFCEEHPGFVFNHNEALLYHWVREYEPELFTRIQRLVKEGRWHIAGGAWLQPDVNGPSGESHIRQFLYGLTFFKRHFKRRPRIAYNFDPFGHPEGFTQILVGCGMQGYLFCRPDYGTRPLPIGAFHWRDRSGSSIVSQRADLSYASRNDAATKLERTLEHHQEQRTALMLWGIGNHGGGPSKREWEALQTLRQELQDVSVIDSTPEAYFREVVDGELETVEGEIQNSFPGCYTSMARVKRAHRGCESLMAQTERLAALAWWLGHAAYPGRELDVAWRDILFSEFHDILPGSGTPRVEQDSLQLLAHAKEVLGRTRLRLLRSCLENETPATGGGVPVFVFNPHGHRMHSRVEFETAISHIPFPLHESRLRLFSEGREIPCQRLASEHNVGLDWQVRVTTNLRLKAWELKRLELRAERLPKPRPPKIPVQRGRYLRLEGKGIQVTLDSKTGLVNELRRKHGASLVAKGAFAPVLFDDLDHSWTCGDPARVEDHRVWSTAPGWRKPRERFRLATPEEAASLSPHPDDKWRASARTAARPFRVIASGPVCTIVEAIFVCGHSALVRHYVVSPQHDSLEVRERVFLNHRDSMLKLQVPLAESARESVSETPYSAVRRAPTKTHEDRSNQRWVAVRTESGCLAIANDGSFAHSLRERELCLNLMRSPAYASFCIPPDDPERAGFIPRQDQGEHQLRFEVTPMARFDEPRVHECALALNVEPTAHAWFPGQASITPRKRSSLNAKREALTDAVRCDAANIHIVALKRAHSGNALIVRLQELRGRRTESSLRIEGKRIPIQMPAYGLKTLRVERVKRRLRWRDVSLVEDL